MKLRKSSIVVILMLWVLVLAFAAIVLNRQSISDWLILRSYIPSPEIAAIAERTAMNEEGRKLFYVHDPQLLVKENFIERCSQFEKSIVLGCFDSVGIYIYDINDIRLDGVEEVTSAHEMLHAAYERLDGNERKWVDAELSKIASKVNNPRLLKLFDSYRQRETSLFSNELHSIIGTEIAELPEEVERYYSQYFSDRSRVVQLAQNYEKVFNDLSEQEESLKANLSLRKAEIDQQDNRLIATSAALEREKSNLDLTSKAAVDAFNTRVNLYNSDLETMRRLASEYNTLVAQYNALVVTQNELVNNLDARALELP